MKVMEDSSIGLSPIMYRHNDLKRFEEDPQTMQNGEQPIPTFYSSVRQ